jgi:hypothetical protein
VGKTGYDVLELSLKNEIMEDTHNSSLAFKQQLEDKYKSRIFLYG